jgi:hypothetical protein
VRIKVYTGKTDVYGRLEAEDGEFVENSDDRVVVKVGKKVGEFKQFDGKDGSKQYRLMCWRKKNQ